MRKIRFAMASLALTAMTGMGFAGDAPISQLSSTTAELTRSNQTLADEVAAQVKSAGLSNYNVDIEAEGGVITLMGKVATEEQRASLLNNVRKVAGVVAVNDKVNVTTSNGLITVGFESIPQVSEKKGGVLVSEPYPTSAFAGGVMAHNDSPALPAYSWPAYTPYNNFASMAYQTQYPSGAWPFIGPPHPYPMIPAGWRSVNLRWSKGYWWLKFRSH